MYLNGILVIEGKTDESLIKSFLDVHVLKCNGFDIKTEDIKFLNKASETYKIIVMTDPDKAGEKIRETINKNVRNTFNVYADINMCDRNGKHGVAESTKEHILDLLKEHITLESPKLGNITSSDLARIGLNGESNSKEKRDYICAKFSLGVCNVKLMKERLNLLNITIEEIREALDNYGN